MLATNLRRFADETTMHGFKELYYSKRFMWKTIWFAVVFAAVGATIFQVYNTIDHYINEPTVSTFQPLTKNELSYPPLRICYASWTSWVDWNKANLLNISITTVIFGMSYLGRVFTLERFNVSEAEKNFTEAMIRNNWTYLEEFYFAISYDVPHHVLYQAKISQIDFEGKEFISSSPILPPALCYTVNGSRLRNLLDFTDPMSTGITNSRKLEITMLKKTARKQLDNTYVELIQGLQWFISNATDLPPFFILNENFDQRLIVMPNIDWYNVQMRANVHRWLSKPDKPCQKEKITFSSDQRCKSVCIASYFNKHCKHLLFSLALAMKKATTPAITLSFGILFVNASHESTVPPVNGLAIVLGLQCDDYISGYENETKNCGRNCTDGCETWDYEVYISFGLNFVSDYSTTVSISYPTEDAIYVISEVNAQTWDSLIGNIGGLVGIWLGASIISFVEIIYFCCFSSCDEKGDCITITPVSQLVQSNQKLT